MAEIVKIEGLEQVRLALTEVPKHLRLKVIHSILRKAAAPILRAAKAAAPKAKKATKRVIPGLLKRTLSITRSKLRNASRGEFGVFITARVPGKIKRLSLLARKASARGPNFGDPYYHRFQEGGFTAIGSRKSGGKFIGATRVQGGKRLRAQNLQSLVRSGAARKIPGKKYLGNAFESNRRKAVDIMRAELVKETVAAFEKRARK